MKKYRSLFVGLFAVVSLLAVGCQILKPTPAGDCPTVTTTGASIVAYAGSLAALENGAPPSVLSKIASNIDAVVVSGQFNADIVSIILENSGGAKWAQYLGGAALLFQNEFNGIVNSNANKQVCTVPVLKNISAGIKQAVALAPKPTAAKLAPYRSTDKK